MAEKQLRFVDLAFHGAQPLICTTATLWTYYRCFQPVPDEIVPLIVDYGFHVGFY